MLDWILPTNNSRGWNELLSLFRSDPEFFLSISSMDIIHYIIIRYAITRAIYDLTAKYNHLS